MMEFQQIYPYIGNAVVVIYPYMGNAVVVIYPYMGNAVVVIYPYMGNAVVVIYPYMGNAVVSYDREHYYFYGSDRLPRDGYNEQMKDVRDGYNEQMKDVRDGYNEQMKDVRDGYNEQMKDVRDGYNEQMKDVRETKERSEVEDFRDGVGQNRLQRKRRSPKQRQKEKNKKSKKPAIELEGFKTSEGKQAWTLAEWVPKRNEYFGQSNGEILIKKSGFYLMYAQITLIGSRKRGFYVKKMSRTADGTYIASIISACTRFSDEDDKNSRNDSCSVHRPCRLDAGDRLFIEPISMQEILYSSSYTYFGLIRMG